MNDFGNMLYKLRKEKGWTQSELADKLGISNQAVSKWETGDSFPDSALLVPLSELFGVTIDALLKGKDTDASHDAEHHDEKEAPSKKDDKDWKSVKPADWKSRFAFLLCLGLGLLFCGIIEIVLVGILAEDFSLYGTVIMLAVFAVGVGIIVYAGIIDSLYYLSVDSAEWKPAIRSFAVKITIGVVLAIMAVAAFTLSGLCDVFPEKEALILSVCLSVAFILLFIAVTFFINGGLRFRETVRTCAPGYEEHKDEHEKFGRFSGVIMLTATAIFLIFGFLFNKWHPAWIVFPVGGILCGILGALDEVFDKKDDEDRDDRHHHDHH